MKDFIKEGKIILFSVFLLILTAAAAQAQIFTGPGFTIVDNGGRVAASCSIVPVSGITSSVSFRSVSLTGTTHSRLGDIEVRVYRPGAAPPPSTAAPSVMITSPPDGRLCNLSGNYRFIDTAAQSVDAATAGCATATNLAQGDYRSSTYGGGTANGTVTSLATLFGALTPAQANGNWLVCVFDFASTNGGTVGGTSIQLVVPTAASASLGGRILTPDGRGIANVRVKITDTSGTEQTTLTSPFGYYRFDDLASGQSYVLSVSSKTHQFENPSRVISLDDNITDADFVSLP